MKDKRKNDLGREEKNGDPKFYNDQLGENAGEGRVIKAQDDRGKRLDRKDR